MSEIVPINPATFMGKSLIDGVGTSTKPANTKEIKQEFAGVLLDQVFLRSFMKDDEEGIFAKEDDELFSQGSGSALYKEVVRAEMIKYLASDERFGFQQLLASSPSLPQ